MAKLGDDIANARLELRCRVAIRTNGAGRGGADFAARPGSAAPTASGNRRASQRWGKARRAVAEPPTSTRTSWHVPRDQRVEEQRKVDARESRRCIRQAGRIRGPKSVFSRCVSRWRTPRPMSRHCAKLSAYETQYTQPDVRANGALGGSGVRPAQPRLRRAEETYGDLLARREAAMGVDVQDTGGTQFLCHRSAALPAAGAPTRIALL